MNSRFSAMVGLISIVGVALTGCSTKESDPLAVTNSVSITDITDNTGTGYHTVDDATLSTNAIGTELELSFTILNSNGIKFSPVSTITFANGDTLTCEADDLRCVPSLVKSTNFWTFACDGTGFPEGGDGASLVVVDSYNH